MNLQSKLESQSREDEMFIDDESDYGYFVSEQGEMEDSFDAESGMCFARDRDVQESNYKCGSPAFQRLTGLGSDSCATSVCSSNGADSSISSDFAPNFAAGISMQDLYRSDDNRKQLHGKIFGQKSRKRNSIEIIPIPYYISTKCFSLKLASGAMVHKQYTIGISNICIVNNEHAEFQVVLGNDDGLWTVWRRFTQFKKFEAKVKSKFGTKNRPSDVWLALQKKKKFGRCLTRSYLIRKSRYLGRYLSELLFFLKMPDLLLEFVDA